jgi:hypothetical protein
MRGERREDKNASCYLPFCCNLNLFIFLESAHCALRIKMQNDDDDVQTHRKYLSMGISHFLSTKFACSRLRNRRRLGLLGGGRGSGSKAGLRRSSKTTPNAPQDTASWKNARSFEAMSPERIFQ